MTWRWVGGRLYDVFIADDESITFKRVETKEHRT
jgi:hypothetical protein